MQGELRPPFIYEKFTMTNRAVFLDRDGTLIEHYDYLTDPDQVKLLPHAAPALRLLKDRGFYLVMVTNQSAVARGLLTEKTLLEIHDRLKLLLAEQGAYLDQIYYCPFHPQAAVEKYRRESDLRKPSPGMLKLAADELNLDLAQSWTVGDDDRDLEAGRRAGCRTIALDVRHASPLVQQGSVKPDFYAVNLLEAANLIIRYADPKPAPSPPQPDNLNPIPDNLNPAPDTLYPIPDTLNPASDTPPDQPPAEIRDKSARNHEIARRKALIHLNHEPQIAEPQNSSPDPAPEDQNTHTLLNQILRELKNLNRRQSFTDFSVPKLIAGITQMLVLFCLILAFWYRSAPQPDPDIVHSCLFLALIFQTLTLTLLIMHKQS